MQVTIMPVKEGATLWHIVTEVHCIVV